MKLVRLATLAVLGFAAACGIFGVIDRAIEPGPKPRPVVRVNIFEAQRIVHPKRPPSWDPRDWARYRHPQTQDRVLVCALFAQPVYPYPPFQDCLWRSLANDGHTDTKCGHDAGRRRVFSTEPPKPPSGDELTAALHATLRAELVRAASGK